MTDPGAPVSSDGGAGVAPADANSGLSPADFAAALAIVDGRVAHLHVRAVTTPLEVRFDRVIDDPAVARRWMAEHGAITVDTYGVVPPGLSAASVLAYLLDALASVAAQAAVAGPVLLDLDPACWSLEVDPQWWYPTGVGVQLGRARQEPDRAVRIAQTEAAYRATAESVATTFPAPGRMSSRQRVGLAADLWDTGLAKALAADATPPRTPPVVPRRSCCLIYTLPGCHECAGCPRLRPRTHTPVE